MSDILLEAVMIRISYSGDIINDVIAPRSTTHLDEAHTLTKSEEAECRRKITAILEQIEGGADEYLDYLDEYIKDYQERYNRDDE